VQSASFTIKAAPAVPAIPAHTTDCSLGSGEAVVRVTSPTGTGLTYRLDDGAYQSGTSFSHVQDGNHTITVRNSIGCTATSSSFLVSCVCLNPAIVTLGSPGGSTCSNTSITVTGNTFGGSATSVTITENGAGSVSPVTISTSPFAFTYTPVSGDAGNTVIISVKGNNPTNPSCETIVIYALSVTENLPAPVVGIITQPSCILSTGSVVLTGLPSAGTWSLRRLPDGVTITGNGSGYTVTSLLKGTYTFTVTNENGCISAATIPIVINDQPSVPAVPSAGIITPPTCAIPTGSVVINGLPVSGQWILTRYPGTIILTGSGSTTTVTGLPPGTYNFTVTNTAGCISIPSQNVLIPARPENPSPPVVGTIIQPNYVNPKGSVFLNGLPSTGTWILVRKPDGVSLQGSGTAITINDLIPGVYTFSVTNTAGCTSSESNEVVIINLDIPIIKITDPAKVCEPSTVDITAQGITTGSTPGLIFTYWKDAGATIEYNSPGKATSGTYYIKGTTLSGYSDIKPVTVSVVGLPVANAGPDQILEYQFETTLDAEIGEDLTGRWSLVSGTGILFDETYAKTKVSDLSMGDNIFLWTVNNGICPSSHDSVIIKANDLIPPSLITPNMDGKNDYFILQGIILLDKTELLIFDRWGVQVYKNDNYDNSWNGVDYNGILLPDDTYFYSIKKSNGKFVKGFIVIRK
jgi:gliding motility-associated-like protein